MKRFLSLILAMLMVTALFVPSAAEDNKGMTFVATELHPLQQDLAEAPATYEAVIRISGNANQYLLFGNFKDTQGTVIMMQLGKTCIRFAYGSSEGKIEDAYFYGITAADILAKGDWVHIAVVRDEEKGEFRAYVDGVFKGYGMDQEQTKKSVPKPYGYFAEGADPLPICIGGDNRSGNTWRFRAELRELVMYSNARTPEQIMADATEIKYDSNMLLWLQLSEGTTTAPDLSGYGNHMGVQQTGSSNAPTFGNYVTVKFETGVEGMIVAPQVVVKGDTVTVSSPPAREGWNFLGWYNGDTKYEEGSFAPSADLTLTAEWEPKSAQPTTYEVTFMADGTPITTLTTKTDGMLSSLPDEVSKEAHIWSGWWSETHNAFVDTSTVFTGKTTVEARWTQIYTITFNAGEGTVTPTTMKTGADGKLTSLPEATRDGYTFGGWYIGTEKVELSKVYTAHTTVEAKWTPNAPAAQTYTITFDAGEGTVTPTEMETGTDGKLASLPEATRDGYTFGGWYIGTEKVELSTVYTTDTTVTAKWIQNTPAQPTAFTVTFDTNGGVLDSSDQPVLTQTVSNGSKAVDPGTPWKNGCDFLGWYNGDAAYDFDTPVIANLTLNAMWKVSAGNKGMSFTTETNPLAEDFDKAPMTIEARIYIPSSATASTHNVIFSNNNSAKDNLISLSLERTCLQLTYWTNKGAAANVYFAVNPWDYRDQNIHIAVVRDDATKQFRAYLTAANGTVKMAVGTTTATSGKPVTIQSYNYSADSTAAKTFYVGGDRYEKGGVNPWFFKHYISEIIVYSDVRTASEIAKDAAGNPDVNEDMLVWLQLSENSGDYGAADLSLNNNNMGNYTRPEPKPAPIPEPDPNPSENIFTSPLFALAALYAQRFDVLLIGENCSISGDTMIKYKRSGVVEISVDEGYELVDVMLDGKLLGPVTKVDIKKVTRNPELVVITRAVGAGE